MMGSRPAQLSSRAKKALGNCNLLRSTGRSSDLGGRLAFCHPSSVQILPSSLPGAKLLTGAYGLRRDTWLASCRTLSPHGMVKRRLILLAAVALLSWLSTDTLAQPPAKSEVIPLIEMENVPLTDA